MHTEPYHTPVLLHEVLELLFTSPTGTYVDATLGGGGHTEALLQKLHGTGRLVGIDADVDALAFSRNRLARHGDRVQLVHQNFGNLKVVLSQLRIEKVDGILFDLGVSSFQLDEPGKGFSFRTDQRLDMRMDRSQKFDASLLINTYGERELAEVITKHGEERHARRIARRIVQRRAVSAVETTAQLTQLVEEAVGRKDSVKSLARVFQALRIEVNNELVLLERALSDAIDLLDQNGRLVVISYHSLEDRIVKTMFKEASATVVPSGTKLLPPRAKAPRLRLLTKKPIEASTMEIEANPRARSAKLRAAERCL